MKNHVYYKTLLDLSDRTPVRQIVRGVSWTAAVLADGRTGVAMHTEGESRPRLFENLESMPACEAAQALLSWNLEEASEGLAVVNAVYNTPERAEAFCGPEPSGALDGLELSQKRVGLVGHLLGHSGITRELLAPAREVFVLERDPREGDYPDSACEYLLPGCDLVVITGSAAINKTLPRLLTLAAGAEIVLAGPSVSLCPALLDLGIARLSGQVIRDADAMQKTIVAKRCSVNAFSRRFSLDAKKGEPHAAF